MSKSKIWGASKAEWDLVANSKFAKDILPVVSNPNAKISGQSILKSSGKTPSLYNSQNVVVGIADWTNKSANKADILQWSQNSDYGICIQTRYLRALDIDVENENLSHEIRDWFINEFVNLGLAEPALRYRKNSAKCLLVFSCEDDLFKRIAKVDGDQRVEFLASGQQFVAFGTHTSGKRYEWQNEGLRNIPCISKQDIETIWKNFEQKFATESSVEKSARKREGNITIYDPIIEALKPLAIGFGKNGTIHITCPFEDEHSTVGGVSECSYMPAGTNGYKTGRFHCFHAHCEGRTNEDFMKALNIPSDNIMSQMVRDKKGILAISENIARALEKPEMCGFKITRDEFLNKIVLTSSEGESRALQDEDYFELKLTLESGYGFKPIPMQLMRDAVNYVSSKNSSDCVKDWLNSLKWDGVKRVQNFYSDYFGVSSSLYTQAVGHYTFSAIAGRVLNPGVKADMSPILIGEQGVGKSRGVIALSPKEEYFVEVSLSDKEPDLARLTRGKLIGEFGEMRGLYAKDLDHLKSYLTKPCDQWVEKYKEQSTTYPRRIFFIGTSNHIEVLTDNTGHRRWLPMEIVSKVDVEKIIADRDQLWAEGAYLFKKYGVLFRNAEMLAKSEHCKYEITDPWEESIKNWLYKNPLPSKPLDKGYISMSEILGALNMSSLSANSGHSRRISEILRKMGFVSAKRKIGNDQTQIRVWVLERKI